MIEIVMDKERNLKNLKQIGTPKEDNKIYIENFAYSRIRDSFQDKRVFVLMGHTERMEGRYATFVEAVIEVQNAEFSGMVPRWNNSMWSQVFRDIKQMYEEMIIVGWAIDIKGMSPKLTSELERVHREHFGGVHQVLFLMDSLEQEETFYIYKENKLVSKDGFYIYYRARKNVERTEKFEVIDLNKEDVSQTTEEQMVTLDINTSTTEQNVRGRYRQIMQEQPKKAEGGNTGLVVAVAMLLFIIGVGAYENKDSIFGSQLDDAQPVWSADSSEYDSENQTEETQAKTSSTGGGYEIPVESVSDNED